MLLYLVLHPMRRHVLYHTCARPFVICTVLGEDVFCVFCTQIDESKCWGARDSIALHDSAQALMLMLCEHCVMLAWNDL